MTTELNIRGLLQAGVHFGHKRRFRNPKMDQYIFCEKNGVNIINLDKTLPNFKRALQEIKRIVSNNGKILFVGTKRSASALVREYANKCDMPYVDYRWLGGMLTNYKTIKNSVRRMEKLLKLEEDGTIEQFNKKEALNLRREYGKLYDSLGGIKDMGGLPDAIFVIDVGQEKIAIKEANRLRIPVIGIIDTNSDPDGVDFPIPGNDDAISSIEYYLDQISNKILQTREDGKASMSVTNTKYAEEFIEVEDDSDESLSDEVNSEATK